MVKHQKEYKDWDFKRLRWLIPLSITLTIDFMANHHWYDWISPILASIISILGWWGFLRPVKYIQCDICNSKQPCFHYHLLPKDYNYTQIIPVNSDLMEFLFDKVALLENYGVVNLNFGNRAVQLPFFVNGPVIVKEYQILLYNAETDIWSYVCDLPPDVKKEDLTEDYVKLLATFS